MRAILLTATLLLSSGCLNVSSGTCANGLVCAEGLVCNDDIGACVTADCGDDYAQMDEECDGTDMNGLSCSALGYYEGQLLCTPVCTVDHASREGRCGDGIVDAVESCDTQWPNSYCTTHGFDRGPVVCSSACGDSYARCGYIGWQAIDLPMSGIEDLIVAENGDVIAVGDGGGLVRYDGTAARRVDTPTFYTLRGVWTGGGELWVVGDEATILRLHEGEWTSYSLSLVAGNFSAIDGRNPSDLYATSSLGLFHFDGQEWSPEPSLGGVVLTALGVTDDRVVVAGDSAEVFENSGQGWQQLPDPPISQQGALADILAGITVTQGGDIIVATLAGELFRYDGNAWSSEHEITTGINSLTSSSSMIAAAGALGKVLVFDGVEWTESRTGSLSALEAVLISGDDIFAGESTGKLYRFSGDQWTDHSMTSVAWDVWGVSPRDFFVASDLGLSHFDGEQFSPPEQPTGRSVLKELWGRGPNEVYAVGDSGAAAKFSNGSWAPLDTNVQDRLSALSGNSSKVWAAGQDCTVIVYESDQWTLAPDQPGCSQTIEALWTDEEGVLFASGAMGLLLRYQGGVWERFDHGSVEPLTGLWGASADHVYAVGGSTVLFFDGVEWTRSTSQVGQLRAVWGSAPNDIFVAGGSGSVGHFDGRQWSTVRQTIPVDIDSLWGAAGSLIAGAQKRALVLERAQPSLWSCASTETDCENLYDDDCDGLIDADDDNCGP
jgi:hypothetical protein